MATVGLLVAALLLPGCLDPYRVHVDEGAVARGGVAWVRSDLGGQSGGFLGSNTVETDYTFSPSSQPPYPGVLQLFGLRESSRRSTTELLALARTAVDNATAAQHIEVEGKGTSGTRTLRNGLSTQWFALEGTVAGNGGLFSASTRVRILGEAGYDGQSSTHLIAVGIAQVESTTCPPVNIAGACQIRSDMRTWTSLAGDTKGSVDGAVSQNGLLDNVVTHD